MTLNPKQINAVHSSEAARVRFPSLTMEAVGIAAPLIPPFASCELSVPLPAAW